MPDYCQPKLEFSADPLSDATPTYVDVTSYLKDASWSSGVSRDLDQPQAGGATFVLRNKNRDWEPEYSAGRFAGNILPFRRFRWSITADGTSRPQGTYYATSYQVVYPDPGSTESDVVVTCADGFALLSRATVGTYDPASVDNYVDLIKHDSPLAYYPMNETEGKTLTAEVGDDGQYLGYIEHVPDNPVVGSGELTARFDAAYGTSYARAPLADEGLFFDENRFTVEAVATDATGTVPLAAGPWNTANPGPIFNITPRGATAWINTGASSTLIGFTTSDPSAGRHHYAATWDGKVLSVYRDGVLIGTDVLSGIVDVGTAGERLYIAGNGHTSFAHTGRVSNVAFYTYPLTADRVAAHADAALTLGRPLETVGTRIAALATHPLWSTAGIPAGQVTVASFSYTGQSKLDLINQAAAAESPIALFYFDDNGNPAYRPWNESPLTIQATFGEQEVQYDDVGLIYDDQVYNQATTNTVTGSAITASDSTSIGQYTAVTLDASGSPLVYDFDAELVAQTIVDRFKDPMYRIESVALNGAYQSRRTQILTREIGDTIRIKRRGAGGTANPDIVTRIIGKSKHLDVNRHLTCSWSLARGFAAATQVWHLSQSGYSELNSTTILA